MMYVNNENIVESKQVVVTDKFGEFYLVEEGLKNGDKIIMEGLQKVRSGMEIVPEVTEFVSQQTPES